MFREDAKKAKEEKIVFEGRKVNIDYADISRRKKKTPRSGKKVTLQNEEEMDSTDNSDVEDSKDKESETSKKPDVSTADKGI